MKESILVTGANRGIGRAVASELARRGHALLVTARRAQDAQRTAEELGASASRQVIWALLDVAKPDSITALAERLHSDGVRLAALVNNAGASFDGFDAEVVQATLETNTFGPLRVSDALDAYLDDGAKVVNVSSGMGALSGFSSELQRRFENATTRGDLERLVKEFVDAVRAGRHRQMGWPSNAYSVSKAGLNLFTRVLAREKPRLYVNAVCPGWVRTDMGGPSASRSVEQGAQGIVWAATLPEHGPSGGFFRDGERIEW